MLAANMCSQGFTWIEQKILRTNGSKSHYELVSFLLLNAFSKMVVFHLKDTIIFSLF